MDIKYSVIRSKRKTVSLSLDKTGEAVVKAGYRTSSEFIERFVEKNANWIATQQKIFAEKKQNFTPLTPMEIAELKREALKTLGAATDFYAQAMGLCPTGVKITSATTRWGSCSGRNSICYSYRVMLLPKECQDYIVVHELSHIKVKNHSKDFYNVVESYLPNYKELQKKIKSFKSYDLP
ncbi:MAG: M48 family metallopeptidase [Oscillospiraceae bacterium]